MNRLHQITHLLDRNDTRFGFGTKPRNIRVVGGIDPAAALAFVAAIERHTSGAAPWRRLAIDDLGEGASDSLQFKQVVPAKQVGVTEASSFQAALKQPNAILLFLEI